MHAAIREDPGLEKKERSKPSETKNWKAKKLTYDERKQKLKVKLFSIHLCTVSGFWGQNPCAVINFGALLCMLC